MVTSIFLRGLCAYTCIWDYILILSSPRYQSVQNKNSIQYLSLFRVDEDGLSDRMGLRVGDQIVEVNQQSMDDLSHSDAVDLMRASRHQLVMRVRVSHFFFLTFNYFTLLREQDKAYINSSRWSMLVGLKLAYIHMWVARSTTVLQTPHDTSLSTSHTVFVSHIMWNCFHRICAYCLYENMTRGTWVSTLWRVPNSDIFLVRFSQQ